MRCAPALLLLPLAAACAGPEGAYPSLAIRDSERLAELLEPAEPAYVPPQPAPAVLDRLEQLTADAASAHQSFLAETPAARRTVNAAAGSTVGSENWARAQVALAGLQATRSRAVIALADLDRLFVDAAVDAADVTRIGSARDRVATQVAEQDTTIDALLGSLPR